MESGGVRYIMALPSRVFCSCILLPGVFPREGGAPGGGFEFRAFFFFFVIPRPFLFWPPPSFLPITLVFVPPHFTTSRPRLRGGW